MHKTWFESKKCGSSCFTVHWKVIPSENGLLFWLQVLTGAALLTFVSIFRAESDYFEAFKGWVAHFDPQKLWRIA